MQFLENPELYDAVIFLSTNPILFGDKEKQDRLKSDAIWSERFLHDDFKTLLKDWNQQSIFSNDSVSLNRKEEDFNRTYLSLALDNWSLAQHTLNFEDLKKMSTRSYWVVGQLDKKFIAIQEVLKTKGLNFSYHVAADKAHRLGLEKDSELAKIISRFIESY